MTIRLGTLPLAAALLFVLFLGAQRADAATYIGSDDTSATPDAFACDVGCTFGTTLGFSQLALQGATTAAVESGVLTEASVNAKRIAGAEPPRIAVLRPDDGVAVTVVDSAPLPVSSPISTLVEVSDLHLRVEAGDRIGVVYRVGEVDLGFKMRARPDGAVVSFTPPGPDGVDGGTGRELLLDAVVEPDVDDDALGDESQDPDGGGLGEDWMDDWFDDFEEGDELDEFDPGASTSSRRRLRLLDVERRDDNDATLVIRVPRAGTLSAALTLPNQRTGAGPFVTTHAGGKRVKAGGRVRLRVNATPDGSRLLARRSSVRTKAVVSLLPKKGALKVRMRSARL